MSILHMPKFSDTNRKALKYNSQKRAQPGKKKSLRMASSFGMVRTDCQLYCKKMSEKFY